MNAVGGGAVKIGVNVTGTIISTKLPETGQYIKEVGNTVVDSSKAVISNATQFADGAVQTTYGAVRKDSMHMEEGWKNIKTSSIKTGKGIVGGISYAGKSVGQTVQGIRNQDKSQVIEGLKSVGKVAAVAAVGIGVLDLINGPDLVQAEKMLTINDSLDGTTHSVTGVPFESSEIKLSENATITGTFPVFDAGFEATLPDDTFLMSDNVHIGISNMQLYEAIQEDPQLAQSLGFDANDIENLKSSVTPEGYDWHHHQVPGKCN